MSDVKTTLKRIGIYYLLLAISIILCANVIPDQFPTRNVSTVYLLVLCVCLVLYYAHRVSPMGGISAMMKSLSWMALLLILLRGVKYSVFSQVGVLARHTWYLYYAPTLLLPLFLFYISLLVSSKDYRRISGGWYWTLALTAGFIALVLTNDLHQLVFRFQPGFENWDDDYTRTWLFYAVTVWQYALYLAAILILVVKCRISSAKKSAWLILIPFAGGIAMNALLATDTMPRINGAHIIEFPESLTFTAAVVLECCMQLGLIPTNTNYGKLFERYSIAAQITDQQGAAVYASQSAVPLTARQFAMPSGSRIGAHTVLHKMPLPGGFGFWQDDLTELDRLNEELAEAKEELQQEAELIRLRSKLKEKQTKLEQRTLVYDTIAKRTQRQSLELSRLAETARRSPDAAVKEQCRNRITLLGAYIKRFANLMLLSQERSEIEAGELGLSFSELLRYLNFYGIPGELISSADCGVPAEAVLALFETFETLLERNLSSLQGVFVNLSGQENAVVKIGFEHLPEPLSPQEAEALLGFGVRSETQQEDDVTYICFTMPKGGETA